MRKLSFVSIILVLLLTGLTLYTFDASEAQDAPTPTPSGIVSIQGNNNTGQVQLATMADLVSQIGVLAWQEQNYTGRGIRIGVLDQGFGGLSAFEQYSGQSVNLAPGMDYDTTDADTITHGTNVLHVIHEIAPEVELFICRYFSFDEFSICVNWIIASEVDIVNHSAGVPALPLDGSNAWAQEVDRAAREDILWINAAGNFAGGFVDDLLTDTNANTYHEFRGMSDIVETLAVQPIGQSYGRVLLSWERTDGGIATSVDLDLEIIDAAGNYIATSNNVQEGNLADEALEFVQINMDQPFGIRIRQVNEVDTPVRIVLFVEFATVPTGRSGGSIIAPGDSLNALTVGATQGNSIAPYSSQGPLTNGALKPDLVAPGELILPNGQIFVGTSAAAPVTAGIAALVWEINPELSQRQLFDLIRESMTTDDGILPGPDNTFGFGAIYLQLPGNLIGSNTANTQTQFVPTATPPPAAEPIQQARVFVTDEGLKLRSGPGTNFQIIENLPSGTIVTVLDGPEYAGGYTWWNVQSSAGNTGWSVESADGITTLVFLAQSPVAVPTPSVRCLVAGISNDAFMRSRPSTEADERGFLPDGENAADAQAIGTDGFVWWRLTSGLWVRSDVVSELGDCDQLPIAPGHG